METIAPVIGVAVLIVTTLVVALVISRRRTKELPVDEARLRELKTEWRGPEELSFRSPPRNVRYAGPARALMAIAAVAALGLVVLAAFLIPMVAREQQNLTLLDQEGVSASATITRQWTTHSKDETNYHVAYTYDVDGRHYASAAHIPRAGHERFDTGAVAAIHYVPSRPEVSRLDGAIDAPPWLKLLIFVPAMALGLIPVMLGRQKKLLTWGTAVGAIVTRVAPTKGGRSIRYAFIDPDGVVVHASEVVKVRDAPKAGDVITVVCDPNRPRRAGRFPFSMVRLEH